MKVIVYHSVYGCESGCCGHTVELQHEDGKRQHQFKFSHPYGEDTIEYAKELVRETFGEEHTKDLDWEHCVISDD